MRRKIISWVLTVVMAASLLATSALAGGGAPAPQPPVKGYYQSKVAWDEAVGDGISVPCMVVDEYEFDKDGRVIKDTQSLFFGDSNGDTNEVIEYQYDSNGNCTKETRTNSSDARWEITYEYNSDGNVTVENCTYSDSSGVQLYVTKYTYAGTRLTRKEYQSEWDNFKYTDVTTYTYDANGNCVSETTTYDGEQAHTTTYQYDTSGRMTSMEEGGVTTTYTYDADGRVTTKALGAPGYGTEFSYAYDTVGNNVRITVTSPTVRELEDGTVVTENFVRDYNYEYIKAPVEEDSTPETPAFTDIAAGAYYEAPVAWAVANNITKGLSATVFGPNNHCTRAQAMTFLWRAAGQPAPTSSNNPFTDVKQGNYYYDAILWAVEKGITKGMSATVFGVDTECTRGQIATFLWRHAGQPAPADMSNPFTDINQGGFSDFDTRIPRLILAIRREILYAVCV